MRTILKGILFLYALSLHAQNDTLFINGTSLNRVIVLDGSTLYVNGTIINNLSNSNINIHNAGTIQLTGNLVSNKEGLFYSSSNATSATTIDTNKIIYPGSLFPLGKVVFAGKDTQQISGNQRVLFNNVDVKNTLKLNQSIHVYGSLGLYNANVNIGPFDIRLFDEDSINGFQSKGNIIGESSSAFIYGTPGKVRAYKNIESASPFMGLALDPNILGFTKINRNHCSINEITDTSIRKYFEVIPGMKNVPTHITIEYLDNDLLPGMQEADLKVWKQEPLKRLNSTPTPDLNRVATQDKVPVNISNSTVLTTATWKCKKPPKFDLGKDTVICSHDTIQKSVLLTNFDSKRVPYSYLWNTGSAKDFIGITAEGKYSVTVTDKRGCETIDSVFVKVNSRPHLETMPRDPFVYSGACIGHKSYFKTKLIAHPSNDSLSFKWYFGNGDSADVKDPVYTYNKANNYIVKEIVTTDEGCDTTVARKNIIIYNLPDAGFSFVKLNSSLTEFTDTTHDALVNLKWVITDRQENFVDSVSYRCPGCHIYQKEISDTGFYNMKLITKASNGGCVDSVSHRFVIKPPSSIKFQPSTYEACLGDAMKFINTSDINDIGHSTVNFKWDFGDGSPVFYDAFSASPVHTYHQTGTFVVTLYAYVSGTDWASKYTQSVIINPLPEIGFQDTLSTCNKFADLIPLCGNCKSFVWSVGSQNSTLRVNTNGSYMVTVTDINQCKSSAQTYVILNSTVKPHIGHDTTVCAPVKLDAGYRGGRYLWYENSTPQPISSNQIMTIDRSGLYSVKVTDMYGCTGTSQVNIIVKPSVKAYLGRDTILCEGTEYILNALEDAGTNFIYSWFKGDVSIDEARPTLKINSAGFYKVKILSTETGCSATDSCMIEYNPAPGFDLGTDKYLCNGGEIELSSGMYIETSNTRWGADNGFGANGVDIKIHEPGKYWATVTNGLGCATTDTISIIAQSTDLKPEFLVASDVYTFDTIQFIQIPQAGAINYQWEFGDGFISTEQNPYHIYTFPDSFSVKLILSDGYCSTMQVKGLKVKADYLKKKRINISDKGTLSLIESARVYPNPSDGIVNFEIKLTAPTELILYIFTLNGNLIDIEKVRNVDVYNKVYNLHGLARGLYILKALTPNESKAFKIMIQ
jgi:PKD repeat protein